MPLTLNETTQMGSVYLFTCARKDKVATLIFLLVTALLYWSFHLVILAPLLNCCLKTIQNTKLHSKYLG